MILYFVETKTVGIGINCHKTCRNFEFISFRLCGRRRGGISILGNSVAAKHCDTAVIRRRTSAGIGRCDADSSGGCRSESEGTVECTIRVIALSAGLNEVIYDFIDCGGVPLALCRRGEGQSVQL